MLIPAAPPPAPAILVRVLRQVAGDGKFGVEDLQTGGQRIYQSYVNAARGRGHRDSDAHACAGANMPCTVLVAAYIGRVVNSLVDALDGETMVGGGEAEVLGGVAQA